MAVANTGAAGSVQPKSSHLSDPSLLPFIQPGFDPADHLNSVLPALSFNSSQTKSANAAAVPLSELSAQTQALLSQLNAQTTRLSTVLTQMTDDILRSGNRLAYEVEVLRGETVGLSEAMTESLRTDVEKFVPGGVKVASAETKAEGAERRASAATATGDDAKSAAAETDAQQDAPELPEYLTRLRTLTHVRSRLESVIKVFGEAMQWTLPPSEVSLASSLISVSAPEPGSDSHSREEKGREFAEKLRNEIAELVTGTDEGYEAAQARIQALRDLSQVWNDTAEEKARTRFVDGLVKLAEEKQRQLLSAQNQRQQKASAPPKREESRSRAPERGNGFLDNLNRMRENIYLS